MAFARKRKPEPPAIDQIAEIDRKLARLGPAIHSRDDQAALVWMWLNDLLDQRLEVTSNGESEA